MLFVVFALPMLDLSTSRANYFLPGVALLLEEWADIIGSSARARALAPATERKTAFDTLALATDVPKYCEHNTMCDSCECFGVETTQGQRGNLRRA